MKQLGTDFLNPLALRKLRVLFGEEIFFGQWTKPSEVESFIKLSRRISKDRREVENKERYNINPKKKSSTEHLVFFN